MRNFSSTFRTVKEAYKNYVRNVVLPQKEDGIRSVFYWRNEIFFKILIYFTPLSLIALIPGLYMSFVGRAYVIGFFDLLTFLTVIAIMTVRNLSLEKRKFIFIIIFYCLSIILIYYLGKAGPGLLFLLALTVISSIIFSSSAGYYSALANTSICIALAILNYLNVYIPAVSDYSLGAWIAVSSNLVLLSFSCARCLDLLLAGLNTSLTANKISEQKLIKGKRLYQFISQINQNIVHSTDERTLFKSSCEIAFNIGKFKMAWIGSFNKALNTVQLLEHMGLPEEEAHHFNLTFEAGGPQDYVIQSGSYFFSNDLEQYVALPKWKDFASRNNIRSFIVLPIIRNGVVFGSFNLYSSETGFFDAEEIRLLQEANGDISFALEVLTIDRLRKDAEELIIKNENRFRALIEKSADMKTLASVSGEIIYASPSVSRILGYDVSEFKNFPAPTIIHPDDLPVVMQKVQDIVQSPGKSFFSQHRLLHKNGTWIWCEGTITNLLNEPGLEALVSNFRDVSEKKRMEMLRLFNENNLNALINNTSDLMWSVDRNYSLITSNEPYNSVMQAVFGKPIEKGTNVLLLAMTPEMYSTFEKAYARAFAGDAYTEIIHFTFPQESWAEISFYPIREGSEIIGTACHYRDITQSKIAEERLKQSEGHLAEAQHLAKMGSWNYDCRTDKLTWSDELYNIFSIDKPAFGESLNSFLQCIDEADRERVLQNNRNAQKNGQQFVMEYKINLKNGEKRIIRDSVYTELNKDGQVIRLFGTAQDVTEKKLAEEEREKMIANIVQHSKNLEQFASIVSHNLRAPVANIMGLSNVLKNDISTADRALSQQYLITATEHLDVMLKDLNKILQVKSQINEFKETVVFEDTLNIIKSSIKNLIDKEKVEIITDFSAVNQITSIKSYIHSIFYNLITNSIKYREPKTIPIINIKSEIDKNKITIVFKDNGVGIDLEKYGDKLFGLYKRFHLHIEGKGLGLFMVKTQIETLGGSIKVESKLGEGTEFKIELPL